MSNEIRHRFSLVRFNALLHGWYFMDRYARSMGGEFVSDAELYLIWLNPAVSYSGLDIAAIQHERGDGNFIRDAIYSKIEKNLRTENSALLSIVTQTSDPDAVVRIYFDDYYKHRRHDADYLDMPMLNPHTLHSVANYGRWLFCSSEKHGNALERIAWGISLIGCARRKWNHEEHCKFCFRTPRPGSWYCEEHTQGGVDPKTRSKQHLSYRLGKLTWEYAKKNGRLSDIGHDRSFKFSNIYSLAKIVFPSYFADQSVILKCDLRLRHALLEKPKILRLLGGRERIMRLDIDGLTKHVRETLDPHNPDTDIDPLSLKLFYGEAWLAIEEVASKSKSSKKRGRGKKTSEQVTKAIFLARQGKNASEIAKEMGVTKSTVTYWKNNSPELGELFLQKKT